MVGGELDDAVTEADVLGALAGGTEEHLGRGAVRGLLEEVVLDLPGVVEPEPVGELDLVEAVLEQLVLGVVGPRPRQLVLVEDPEFHAADPIPRLLVAPAKHMCVVRAARTKGQSYTAATCQ